MTSHAPVKEASIVQMAAGSKADQLTWMRRLYCQVANPVPHIDALLLVPSKVAGVVVGYAANKAGSKINPPPPTIESTKPAKAEAKVVKKSSMRGLWSLKASAQKQKAPGRPVPFPG